MKMTRKEEKDFVKAARRLGFLEEPDRLRDSSVGGCTAKIGPEGEIWICPVVESEVRPTLEMIDKIREEVKRANALPKGWGANDTHYTRPNGRGGISTASKSLLRVDRDAYRAILDWMDDQESE